MKKNLIIIPLIIIVFLFFVFSYVLIFEKKKSEEEEQVLSMISMPKNTVEISYGNSEYWITWQRIEKNKNLILYPNFEDKYTTEYILVDKKCQRLVSGGFYSEEDEPLGLFIAEGITYSSYSDNSFLDGIFYTSYDGDAGIAKSLPEKNVRFALQSGPLLLDSQGKRDLRLRKDKTARRVVVALTKTNEIVFLVIYDKDNIYLGPYLDYLPELIFRFQEQAGMEFNSALNLDGGRASAFYSPDLYLEEVFFIGSYFCFI